MSDRVQAADSAAERLERAAEETDHSAIRRVLRELRDHAAAPASLDYLTAIQATGGDVALKIKTDTPGDVAIRGGRFGGEKKYQWVASRDGNARKAFIRPSDADRILSNYAVRPVLERDVRDLFDSAEPTEYAPGRDTAGSYEGP